MISDLKECLIRIIEEIEELKKENEILSEEIEKLETEIQKRSDERKKYKGIIKSIINRKKLIELDAGILVDKRDEKKATVTNNLDEIFNKIGNNMIDFIPGKTLEEKKQVIINAKFFGDFGISFEETKDLLERNGYHFTSNESDKSIKEKGRSFVEQVRKLNEKYGMILTLNELQTLKKNGELKFEKEGPIDEYAFVHITDFEPEDDVVECNSSKIQKGKTKQETVKENTQRTIGQVLSDDKLKEYEGLQPEVTRRNKVHLTVNGRVISHGGGNWNIRKFGIIIPARDFIKDNKDEIYSVSPEDSFVRDSVKSKNGILLCPKSDYDVLHELNPNILIIPVDEEMVVNVANGNDIDNVKRCLQLMDIETRKCEEQGWMKNGEIQIEDTKIFQEIVREEMGRAPMVQDRYSILKFEETIQDRASSGLYEIFKEGDFKGELFFIKPGKTEQELSEKQLKGSIKRIDDILVKNGMSSLQIFEQSYDKKEYDDRYLKRIKENEKIEEYLGAPLKDMYDGDMITTNAKRIKMIHEKMKEERDDKNPIAEEVFEACVRHFVRDYKTLSQIYDKRIDMEGFDFEKYTADLKETFMELGLESKDIELKQEEKLAEQATIEIKIKDMLEQIGYVEEPSIDLSQRSVNRLKFAYDVMYKSAIEDYKSGNIDTDDKGTIPNGEKLDKSYVIRGLIEKELSKKLGEMENPQELTSQLEEMGFYVDKNGKIESDDKIDELLNRAEMQAQKEQQGEKQNPNEEIDSLIESYGKAGIEPADLQNARNQMENTISQDKGQNQSTKEGEENDEH